ncbi:MAG: MFS transporter [Spirochaetes bacterium]|nr:MFS transporter [Spirochaetota bacterium]
MKEKFDFRNRLLIIILMALNIIFLTADKNIISAVLIQVENEFNVTTADLGLMSFLFTIVGAAVSLIWGYFTDKVDRKKLFAYSICAAEIPCALTYFAPNFTVFFILRILTGIGVGAAFPIVFSLLGDIFDKKGRTLAAAILTTCWGIGGLLGVMVAGYAIGAGLGWRLPFVMIALPNFILIGLFYFIIPDIPKGASEDALKELIARGLRYPGIIKLKDYIRLAKIKTNLLLFIQGLAGNLPWGALFLLIKFLQTERGFDVNEATTIYGIFGVGAATGGVIGGAIGGKLFGIKPVYQPLLSGISTITGAFITLSILYFVPNDFIVVAITGFFGAAWASITGANIRNMLLSVNRPEDRGPIFSIFNLTDSVGFGIGEYIAGTLAVMIGITHALGVSFAFWIPCGTIILIAAIFFGRDVANLDNQMQEVALKMKLSSESVAENL